MNRIRKVTIVTSEFPPLPGGIGNHAYNLAKFLQKNDFEIRVITNLRGSQKFQNQKLEGINSLDVIEIQRKRLVFLTYIYRIFICLKIFYAEAPHYVIASGKFSLWTVAISKWLFPRNRYVGVIHGTELKIGNTISRRLTAWSIHKLDDCIAVSNYTKSRIIPIIPNKEVVVINNGFSLESNATLKIDKTLKGRIKLVTVGSVSPRKGQDNVIKALAHIVREIPEIHYHIVGIPTYQEDFEILAEKLNLKPFITFHGMVAEERKIEILRSSNIFIMLSSVLENGDFEGFGIAILEANALGVPGIGSNDSGIADAIANKYSGLLVSPQNSNEILSAIKQILKNYDSYSKNSKEWSRKFSWESKIKEYIRILQ